MRQFVLNWDAGFSRPDSRIPSIHPRFYWNDLSVTDASIIIFLAMFPTIFPRSIRRARGQAARSGQVATTLASVLATLLVLHANPLFADPNPEQPPPAEADNRARAAKKACLSGDYPTGVALLADLYVATNNLTYLFNQARCFEQNGRYAEAIVRFREYQRKIRAAGRAPDDEADRHIAECEALIKKERAPAVATLPTPSVADREGSAPVTTEVEARPSDSGSAGSGLRIAGLSTVVVGVLGIGAGVLLNIEANQIDRELTSSPTSFDRDKASTRSNYETWAWVGYGAGAACVLGGSILYLVGHSNGAASRRSLAMQPVIVRDGFGAALRGSF